MSDQLLGWLSVVIGGVSLYLQIKGNRPKRTRRLRIWYRRWKFGRYERTRLDVTDDRQS